MICRLIDEDGHFAPRQNRIEDESTTQTIKDKQKTMRPRGETRWVEDNRANRSYRVRMHSCELVLFFVLCCMWWGHCGGRNPNSHCSIEIVIAHALARGMNWLHALFVLFVSSADLYVYVAMSYYSCLVRFLQGKAKGKGKKKLRPSHGLG